MEDPIWYPPINVIHHFYRLEGSSSTEERSSKSFRKAEEMYVAALMLIGRQKHDGRKYWLQLVDDRHQSPDVRSIAYKDDVSSDVEYQDIEVVTYDAFSKDAFLDFLKRTKLGKGYDSKTTILCYIKRPARLPPFSKLHAELVKLEIETPVLLIGKADASQPIYRLADIHPGSGSLEFDLRTEAARQHTRVQHFLRSTKRTVRIGTEKHFPFEKIGLDTSADIKKDDQRAS